MRKPAFVVTLMALAVVPLSAATVTSVPAYEAPPVATDPFVFFATACVATPGLPECSEASLANASDILTTVCPLGGFVELWCDENGGIDQLRAPR